MSNTPLTDAALIDNAEFSDWGYGKSNYVSADDMRQLEERLNAFCKQLGTDNVVLAMVNLQTLQREVRRLTEGWGKEDANRILRDELLARIKTLETEITMLRPLQEGRDKLRSLVVSAKNDAELITEIVLERNRLRSQFDECNREYGRERREHSQTKTILINQQELNVQLEAERDQWRECAEQLKDAILLIKPMAKGYAAAHRIGTNDRLITDAEEAVAAYERLKGTK